MHVRALTGLVDIMRGEGVGSILNLLFTRVTTCPGLSLVYCDILFSNIYPLHILCLLSNKLDLRSFFVPSEFGIS